MCDFVPWWKQSFVEDKQQTSVSVACFRRALHTSFDIPFALSEQIALHSLHPETKQVVCKWAHGFLCLFCSDECDTTYDCLVRMRDTVLRPDHLSAHDWFLGKRADLSAARQDLVDKRSSKRNFRLIVDEKAGLMLVTLAQKGGPFGRFVIAHDKAGFHARGGQGDALDHHVGPRKHFVQVLIELSKLAMLTFVWPDPAYHVFDRDLLDNKDSSRVLEVRYSGQNRIARYLQLRATMLTSDHPKTNGTWITQLPAGKGTIILGKSKCGVRPTEDAFRLFWAAFFGTAAFVGIEEFLEALQLQVQDDPVCAEMTRSSNLFQDELFSKLAFVLMRPDGSVDRVVARKFFGCFGVRGASMAKRLVRAAQTVLGMGADGKAFWGWKWSFRATKALEQAPHGSYAFSLDPKVEHGLLLSIKHADGPVNEYVAKWCSEEEHLVDKTHGAWSIHKRDKECTHVAGPGTLRESVYALLSKEYDLMAGKPLRVPAKLRLKDPNHKHLQRRMKKYLES